MILRLMPVLFATLSLAGLCAQGRVKDPMQEIQELIEQARKDLDAAERHLLEATTQPAAGTDRTSRELSAAIGKQESVVAAIQKILDSIPPESGGGSSGPPPPRQDQQPPPDAAPREREQKPDVVEGRDRPEGQHDQTGPEEKAAQEAQEARNRKADPPTEDPTGPSPPAEGRAYWGNLPRFLQDIFRAGEEPKIPEKYAPFWRAFQQRNQDQEKR